MGNFAGKDGHDPTEWAVISLESSPSPQGTGTDVDAGRQSVKCSSSPNSSPASPGQGPPSKGSPLEQSWQEQDSGLEPQGRQECSRDELVLALLGLLEHHVSAPGLSPSLEPPSRAAVLLRRLIKEREELIEEVRLLKDTLKTERSEWHQFQCDLQVAVSVADRLRLEAEENLGALRESLKNAEAQLARAHCRQQDTDRVLEGLRAQHKSACQRLSALSLERKEKQPTRPEPDTQRPEKGSNAMERMPEDGSMAEEHDEKKTVDSDGVKAEKAALSEGGLAQGDCRSPDNPLKGKGVAEIYLRNLSTAGEKGCTLRDPRKIVMLSERSRSLCRLPLSIDTLALQNGMSQNISSTTLPLCKKEEPDKLRRMDHTLQRQDSWSSFDTTDKPEDQNTDASFSFRPQDGFSMLLRRHGGSRRNSLLRWCQTRTQGYKNIEITNFSSSWEDGLAFCAVYHTYLPTHIPYSSLSPEDKKENLSLAFHTGESVGVTATLAVEEMLKPGGPDWQRVLRYVESMFRHFEMLNHATGDNYWRIFHSFSLPSIVWTH
ncbi:hypothetical protein UPYG_G00254720 [Umbra pygmaea]|uniref:Cytospin-A n=1 Tax=Umbra pygmaea TaxID=75934 RepID=A0ABD0WYA3_UMBPY